MKNKKIILIIILILLILVAVGIIITVNILNNKSETKNEDTPPETNEVYNYRQEIIEEKEVNGITFTNIDCYWDGTNSNISYTITNTTEETINLGVYTIEVYDDTDTLMYTLSPYLGKDLAPNEEYEELISTSNNLTDAYSIKIFIE